MDIYRKSVQLEGIPCAKLLSKRGPGMSDKSLEARATGVEEWRERGRVMDVRFFTTEPLGKTLNSTLLSII